MIRFDTIRCSLAAMLLVTACGAVDDTDDGDPSMDPGPDTEAPVVASTEPAANAVGVRADAKIFVTFSEQMDPATVAAAYSSSDLPDVEMHWNAEGTVLEIQPAAPLEYQAGLGTDPSVVDAKTYSFTIDGGAKDIAGNALQSPLQITFATKKEMLASFPLVSDLSRVIRDTTVLSEANPMWIGDNSSKETYRSYLTYDLSALPDGADVEAAELSAMQAAPSGLPYSLGAIVAQHVTYSTIDGAAGAQAISLPGTFSEDGTIETKRLDVTNQVVDDALHRAERNSRSQYRLQIDTATNNDGTTDTAVFSKQSFNLLALFLVD